MAELKFLIFISVFLFVIVLSTMGAVKFASWLFNIKI